MVSEIPEGFVKGRSKGETKRQETNLKRYGKSFNLLVDLDAIQSRRKQTCLRKYGGISPTCSSEVRAKVKQAWSEKSEEELEAIKSKSRQTWENKTLEEKEATKSKRRKTWSEKSDEEIKAIQSKRRKSTFLKVLVLIVLGS